MGIVEARASFELLNVGKPKSHALPTEMHFRQSIGLPLRPSVDGLSGHVPPGHQIVVCQHVAPPSVFAGYAAQDAPAPALAFSLVSRTKKGAAVRS